MLSGFLDQIKREALAEFPCEAVWLITEKGCRKVRNISPKPTEKFEVSPGDLSQAYSEGLLAIVHSHPNHPPYPSESDMLGQVQTAVPWGIVCTDGVDCSEPFWWGLGTPPPLLGRPFRHGVTDCYSLIRDYYAVEQGINLPEFPRSWEWWEKGQNLYLDGFSSAGFRVLQECETPVEGDMWISSVTTSVPSHGGIYLGGDLILHHTTAKAPYSPGHLSRREPIHRWLPYITHWLRHEEME